MGLALHSTELGQEPGREGWGTGKGENRRETPSQDTMCWDRAGLASWRNQKGQAREVREAAADTQ